MIKKTGYFIFAVMFIAGIQSTFFTSKVYAQGNTKVALSTDKSYYNVGDTVKVTVQAQDVVDLFGVQFTFHYNSNMLSMEGDNFTFSNGYTVFGGSTVDKEKGVITYPVINKKPSSDKKDSVTIGYANFKANKEGPITLIMDNIKSVNSESVENNYNTQTQAVLNITKMPSNTGNNSNGNNSSNDSNNGNGTGNVNQGNDRSNTGNVGQSSGNTNQTGNSNNSSTSFNSDSTSNSTSGDSDSSGIDSDGSTNTSGNADGLTASTGSNGNQAANGSTSTTSQSGNGNSTNQNAVSNDTKNSVEGRGQNASKDTTKKQTLNSKSNFSSNIILSTVLAVLVIVCCVFTFFNRKMLKDILFKIMKKKN